MSTPSSRPILYSGPLSMFGAKAEIAVLEKRLDVEVVMVSYESRAGYSPKHPEVVRVNPKQQVRSWSTASWRSPATRYGYRPAAKATPS